MVKNYPTFGSALARMSDIMSTNSVIDTFFNDFFGHDFPTNWVEVTDYPKFNIIDNSTESERVFTIEIAVAGFTKDDIKITTADSVLTVEANAPQRECSFINKGIAGRSFKWSRTLPKYSKINDKDIKLENGILTIVVRVQIPEAEQLKTYKIK